jgi:hypothetical protein
MAAIRGGTKAGPKLAEMAKRLTSAKTVRIGFLENATYPNGLPVALVAAINEFGAPSRGQPPRPFFRNLLAAKQNEWPKAIAALLKANDGDAHRTLMQTGEAIAGQLRQSIIDLVDPPLAPSTVQRKGFDKPLIDRGIMLASVDFQVK